MLTQRKGGEGVADGFLDLPRVIYCDDPRWIPEDREALAAAFGPQSPWPARGELHSLCVPGAARASVFSPRGLEVGGLRAAFFGHWETIGDPSADALVMDAARSHARDAGAARLYGPVDFSTGVRHSVRIGGDVEGAPYLGEPYNPPGYAGGLEALGLSVCRRYVGPELAEADLRALAVAGERHVSVLSGCGYRFERITVGTWLSRRDELYELANVVFSGNFAFEGFSRAEFEALFGAAWAARLDPEASVLALDPRGAPAGFVLSYPHYAPLLVPTAGKARIRPVDPSYAEHWPHLARVDTPTTVLKTAGVAPGHRRGGLATAMIATAARRALARGTVRVLVGPMHSENTGIRRVFRHGIRAERWYGIYEADLERSDGS